MTFFVDSRKLLSWAWLTCIFFIPEMLIKSAANAVQVPTYFHLLFSVAILIERKRYTNCTSIEK